MTTHRLTPTLQPFWSLTKVKGVGESLGLAERSQYFQFSFIGQIISGLPSYIFILTRGVQASSEAEHYR